MGQQNAASNGRGIAIRVAQAYLESTVEKLLRVSDALSGGVPLPHFDFAAVSGGAAFGLKVRSSTIQRNERWSSTTHTYINPTKMAQVCDAIERGQLQLRPVVAFVMLTRRPTGPGLFYHGGQLFNVVGVSFSDYLKHMRPRAQCSSWTGNYDVPADDFEAIARPLTEFF